MTPMATGRQPKLDQGMHEAIVRNVAATGNFTASAGNAGIDRVTLGRWRNIGNRVNDPDHPDHIAKPSAHEKRCAALCIDVDKALDRFHMHVRAKIAEQAFNDRRTVRRSTRAVIVDGKVQMVEEEQVTIEGPSLRAMTFILDRIDPPTVGVKVEGAVEVTVAEAAAQVRGKLAALVGIGPRRGDEDDDAPLALDDDELLEG